MGNAEKKIMKEEALLYKKRFGFNITKISKDANIYNVGRNRFKHPNHSWEHFEYSQQSIDFINKGNWDDIIGIGTVLGFNKLRALDIDYCDDIEFIQKLLNILKLPLNYEWVVKSGSHKGFHILFYSEDNRITEHESLKIAYGSNSKYNLAFKKIEFRWKKHLVLPPSLHESSNRYEFLFSIPVKDPLVVEIEDLLNAITTFCKCSNVNNLSSNLSMTNYSSSEDDDNSSSEDDDNSSSEDDDSSSSEYDDSSSSEDDDSSSSEDDDSSSSEDDDSSSSEDDDSSSSEDDDSSSSEYDDSFSSEDDDSSSSEYDDSSSSEDDDSSSSEDDDSSSSEDDDSSSSEYDDSSSSEDDDSSSSEDDDSSSSEDDDSSSSEDDDSSSSEDDDSSSSEDDDSSSSEDDDSSSSEDDDSSSTKYGKTLNKKDYYLFFDTETNGLPRNWKAPMNDLNNWPRMLQIAWVLCDSNGKIIESEDYIIIPENFIISKDASIIHGITTERAFREGKDLKLVLNKFNRLIENSHYIVAHNISFDEMIVGAEFIRNNIQSNLKQKSKLCTMESSTNFCKIPGNYGYKWPKLSELYLKLFGQELVDAHNASVDIRATVKCFWEMRKRGLI